MPSSIERGGVVVLDETTAPLTLQVAALDGVHAQMSDLLALSVERLWQRGIRAALCTAEVHEEWRGALARRGIMLLHLVEESELALAECSCVFHRVRLVINDLATMPERGVILVASVQPLEPRSCQQLAAGRALWAITPADGAPHSWLLLRAPSHGLAVEYKYALQRLLRVVCPALEDPTCVIAGGFAFELALARLAQKLGSRGCDGGRLSHIAWQTLSAALLNTLGAFVAKLAPPPPPTTSGVSRAAAAQLILGLRPPVANAQRRICPEASRLARWLVAAAPAALEADGRSLGLRRLPLGGNEPAFGFALSPGTDAVVADGPGAVLLETATLKITLLHALCSLCRQLARLDPDSLQHRTPPPRGTTSVQRRRVPAEDSSEEGDATESD
eukprot:NODE_9046_length_1450_cov_6.009070.p1 GENE.NODE_9046_length_1450_cov_6.009070~~NODE_9046_length_1450_cov_6.009070.p1  ORF type:complete len:399 (+),score=116.31 NODE_9046_length_1450_cov_6.009070:32-1198(+)